MNLRHTGTSTILMFLFCTSCEAFRLLPSYFRDRWKSCDPPQPLVLFCRVYSKWDSKNFFLQLFSFRYYSISFRHQMQWVGGRWVHKHFAEPEHMQSCIVSLLHSLSSQKVDYSHRPLHPLYDLAYLYNLSFRYGAKVRGLLRHLYRNAGKVCLIVVIRNSLWGR